MNTNQITKTSVKKLDDSKLHILYYRMQHALTVAAGETAGMRTVNKYSRRVDIIKNEMDRRNAVNQYR